MTTKDEVLKLALEALELSAVTVDSFGVQSKTQAAITAIKEALAAPVQEPAFWYYTLVVEGEIVNDRFTTVNWDTNFEPFGRRGVDHGGDVTKEPLYTTPPAAPVQDPVVLRPGDVTVEVLAVQSGGGFAPFKTHGVKLTHKPTGVTVQCSSERSQHRNREKALRELEHHLYGAHPQTAAQPALKPLTDEQWQKIADIFGGILTRHGKDAIEQVLGIKERGQ